MGMFDKDYLAVNDVASSGPAFELDDSLVCGVEPEKSELLLGTPFTGTVYIVSRVEPDGAGRTLLRLRKKC